MEKQTYTKQELIECIHTTVNELLSFAMDDDAAKKISDKIFLDVAKDIEETADFEKYSIGDATLAIGRVLKKKFSIVD